MESLTKQIAKADRNEWWAYQCDLPKVRSILWIIQDGRCSICGERLSLTGSTVDHVVPKSKRLKHRLTTNPHVGNVLLAHEGCNRAKANADPARSELILLSKVNSEIAKVRMAMRKR